MDFVGEYDITSADAKRDFFLTPADLAALPSEQLREWGAGNTKLYNKRHLLAAAVAKHGEDGLRKKIESRAKREDKKRKREDVAAAAAEQLRLIEPVAAQAAVGDAGVRGLIAEARRALKAFCTWDYLRSKNSPNGASVSARIERVEQAQYAGIIGRAADPGLRSLVKV